MLAYILRRFLADRTGTTAIEYGLIVATCVLGIIVIVVLIGQDVLDMFTIDPGAFQ